MNKLAFICVLFLTSFSFASGQECSNVLDELDLAISNKKQFHNSRQKIIDSLKCEVKESKPGRLYSLYNSIYSNYINYQVDSAYNYINLIMDLPIVKEDTSIYIQSSLQKSVVLGLMGNYKSAIHILDSINVNHLNPSIRTEYFFTCRTVYGWYSDFLKGMRQNNNYYESLTQVYRDSILQNTYPGVRRSNVLADNLIHLGEAETAIDVLEDIVRKAHDEQKIYAYYYLAQCYKSLHDDDNYARYLALTAISDIKSGICEYKALPELASLMLKKGEVHRAYNYLFCSMEDANFCNSYLRTFEVNSIFPIIEKEYSQHVEQTERIELIIYIAICILSVMLLLIIFYFYKQKKCIGRYKNLLCKVNSQLDESKNCLNNLNDQLAQAQENQHKVDAIFKKLDIDYQGNDDSLNMAKTILKQSNNIKDDYVVRYFETRRSHIDSLEKYRRTLLRLLRNNQLQDLLNILKSEDVIEKEYLSLYHEFDKAFLSIYPDFIYQFNTLLKKESQVYPKKDELMTPELRIFALIRLGVDDSATIAHLLNYSMPTIYNYRSRVRNNSIYDKDEFLKRVMEIY